MDHLTITTLARLMRACVWILYVYAQLWTPFVFSILPFLSCRFALLSAYVRFSFFCVFCSCVVHNCCCCCCWCSSLSALFVRLSFVDILKVRETETETENDRDPRVFSPAFVCCVSFNTHKRLFFVMYLPYQNSLYATGVKLLSFLHLMVLFYWR